MSLSRAIRAVPQEHGLGCSVACVAFRCGRSYRTGLKLFSRPENAWIRGFYCGEIVEALSKAGLCYAFKKHEGRQDAPVLKKVGTIVFIEAGAEYPSGHFLIRSSEGWMNSWLNFPQMIPVKAGFQERLSGKIAYLIYET